jgi:hypothetical protein
VAAGRGIFAGLGFLEELSVSDVLGGVFAHDPSELGQGIGSFLLVFNGNGGVMAEIHSAYGKQVLYIEMLNQGGEVVLDSLVPAHSHCPAMQLAHRV